MPRPEGEDLFPYFERELLYLRNEGAEFARTYPKVAGRLDLHGYESRDPHTERLLESFAFLTARIQRTLDADFPLIPSALLEALYPQLVAPVPSMAIARLEVDPAQARAARGFDMTDNVPLYAEDKNGLTCRFRTCYPVELWPVDAVGIDLPAPAEVPALAHRTDVPAVLRLRLRTLGTLTFADVRPGRLRLFLDADPLNAGDVYELLLNRTAAVMLVAPKAKTPGQTLAPDAVRAVGFEESEDVLPFPPTAHQGYRLIREYFTFPQKFLFFDLHGLEGWPDGREAELLFLLDRPLDRVPRLDRVSVKTNCVPIINLFRKTSEPLRLDHTQSEYRLLPDSRWERATEVHSITRVSAVAQPDDDTRLIRPYFSYDHAATRGRAEAFWIARRRPSGRADLPGSDIWLSFVDLTMNPGQVPSHTVFAHTLCTNRGLAEQLSPGAVLSLEQDAPVHTVVCLSRPTPQIPAPSQGETLWRLVSALSLNHLSLADGHSTDQPPRALQELLLLYGDGAGPEVHQQISGLHRLSARPTVRRLGTEAWRGFVRGTEVTLDLDRSKFIGSNPFLLASVLDRFLALYAGVNSFTQLVLRATGREEEWKRWPARVGARHVL